MKDETEQEGTGTITYRYYKLEGGKYVLVDEDNPEKTPTEVGTYYIQG